MILNCPNCIAEFYVEDGLLKPEGQKVKCSSCAHVWFHKSVEDNDDDTEGESSGAENGQGGSDGVASSALDAEDSVVDTEGSGEVEDDEIDEALERAIERLEEKIENDPDSDPLTAHSSAHDDTGYRPSGFTSALSEKEEAEKKRAGLMAAAGVFVLSLVFVFLFGGAIVASYPSSQALLGVFGVRSDIPGKGLGFDGLEVVTDGHSIQISGRVVNYDSGEREVPKIIAFVKNSHDKDVGEFLIIPAQDLLPELGMFSFRERFDDLDLSPKDNYSVTLRFAMPYESAFLNDTADAKTVSKGGENSQAHHSSESDHQNDHGASAKSHLPASSGAHQEPSLQSHH